MPRVATRREYAGREDHLAARVVRRVIVTDAPENWQTLVEQIAELEDLLTENAPRDPDAYVGRAWLEQLLTAKRRRLRNIDVAL